MNFLNEHNEGMQIFKTDPKFSLLPDLPRPARTGCPAVAVRRRRPAPTVAVVAPPRAGSSTSHAQSSMAPLSPLSMILRFLMDNIKRFRRVLAKHKSNYLFTKMSNLFDSFLNTKGITNKGAKL